MDRSLSSTSMDNVLDSLLFKAAQFPRTDSEDQFRKFLERIPSTTNLAQKGEMPALPQAQQEHLQQQMAHIQQQSLQLAGSAAPLSTQLPEGGSLNVGGIPRVPSLDLLRQLVQQQQAQQQTSASLTSKPLNPTTTPLKEEAESSLGGSESVSRPTPLRLGQDALRSVAEPNLGGLTGPSGPSVPMSVGGLSQPVPSQMAPSAAAAAALQLSSLQSAHPLKKPESHGTGKDGKAEVRRARRMLSNRESARRSRRRKQEHLSLLEEQISLLEEERDQLQQRLEKVEGQLESQSEQTQALRRENEELRQQLGIEVKVEKRGNKRMCNGH